MFRQYTDLPRAVHLLCLGTFVNRAGTFVIPFLTIYIGERMGLGVGFATGAMGVFGLGAIVGAVGGGHLADRIGRRIVMLLALFGSAAILIGYSFLGSAAGILIATLCFAAVGEAYRPAASAMIADLVEPLKRPQAYALMYVSINLGFAIGPVVGGALAQYSFKWLFWGDAATSALYALLILVTIRETLPRLPMPKVEVDAAPATGAVDDGEVSTRADDGRGQASGEAEADIGFLPALQHMLTDRTFVVFCLGAFFTALVYMQAMSTFPLYLNGRGIGPASYGRIIAVNGMLIVVAQLPFTALLTRVHRGWAMVIGAGFVAVGFGLKGLAVAEWQFVLTVLIWTVGEMMQAPLVAPIVSDLAPTALRARYMGVLGMSFSGANMIGAPLGGLVLARFGGGYVWMAAALLALVAGLLYLSIRKRITQPGG